VFSFGKFYFLAVQPRPTLVADHLNVSKKLGSSSTVRFWLFPTIMSETSSTQLQPAIEPDIEVDEGYDGDSAYTDSMKSITSSIRKGVMENGRRYASYGQHGLRINLDCMTELLN
jgi:hypothetical protein